MLRTVRQQLPWLLLGFRGSHLFCEKVEIRIGRYSFRFGPCVSTSTHSVLTLEDKSSFGSTFKGYICSKQNNLSGLGST